MLRRLLPFACYLLLSLLLSSCSSGAFSDLFSGYNQQMQIVRTAQLKGNFTQANQLLPIKALRADAGLMLLESGRLQYLASNWQGSKQKFEQAYQQVQSQQQQAKVQLSRGVENIGALISNDSALSYEIPPYEQSMLHSYQALNYLYQSELESALVEVRRANLVQEQALKDNQKQLAKAQKSLANSGISNSSLNNSYPSMSGIIGDVKNGFQNAYTFYLSGLLYEAAGESNDAYIDYKKALEIFPHNFYLQQDVLRLAKKLVMSNDLQQFERQFGQYQADDENTGQLVIIMEQGIINAKESVGINLPIYTSRGDMRFYSVALPTYRQTKSKNLPLTLAINEQRYQSEVIVHLQSLVAKQLQDQLPKIVTRQVLRLVTKEEIRQQLSRKGGEAGNIIASLYNLSSEKADTRSWSTLPENVQIIRVNLAEGKHQLNLNYAGRKQLVDVEISAGRICLINFTALASYTGYQAVNL